MKFGRIVLELNAHRLTSPISGTVPQTSGCNRKRSVADSGDWRDEYVG